MFKLSPASENTTHGTIFVWLGQTHDPVTGGEC